MLTRVFVILPLLFIKQKTRINSAGQADFANIAKLIFPFFMLRKDCKEQ